MPRDPLDAAADRMDAELGREVPDAKRPLFRPLPPAPPFPGDALGELRTAAEAIHEATRAPFAICAQSVLAAATLPIAAHRDVELPCGRRPLTGLFVSVAESGERKSSVDRLALKPIHKKEAKLREAHEAATTAFMNEKVAWDAAREHARKVAKGDKAALRTALDAIGPAPAPPASPMLLVADPTPEALVLHLAEARSWAGLFTAEGGILIGGGAFNDEARMRTGALLNVLWDGDAIRRRRVLTGTAYLPGRRCSAHVMMQPVVATRLLSDHDLDGIGLLARTLIVAPDSTAGTRFYREPTQACRTALDYYESRLALFLDRPPATAPEQPDVLDPQPLVLHADARAMWVAFHDVVERAIGPDGELATIRAFGAKMVEHAGRLAANLAAYSDPETIEVQASHMAAGIKLAQHYAAELIRSQGGAAVAPDLRLADRLLAWWQARTDPRCHLAAIYQRGLNAIGDAATARRVVAILDEHGWITRLPAGTVLDGMGRRDAWELVP